MDQKNQDSDGGMGAERKHKTWSQKDTKCDHLGNYLQWNEKFTKEHKQFALYGRDTEKKGYYIVSKYCIIISTCIQCKTNSLFFLLQNLQNLIYIL